MLRLALRRCLAILSKAPLSTGRAGHRSLNFATLSSNINNHQMAAPSKASPVQSVSKEIFGNFDLVKRFKLNFTDVVISKWRSRVTGLSIVHLDYDGEFFLSYNGDIFSSSHTCAAPIVNGYFVVATESTSASRLLCLMLNNRP
jgi:hypothetical protein